MDRISRFIRNFIIGSTNYIPSIIEYKSAMLRGFVCMLTVALGVFNIVVDLLNHINTFYFWYLLIVLSSLVSFVLNRRQYYLASSITLLIMGNAMAYLFSSRVDPSLGTYFYFIVTGTGALTLFGYSKRWIAYCFAALSFILALLAYQGNVLGLIAPPQDEQYIQINFISNFTIAFIITVLIIYFLITLHHNIESFLWQSEQSLLQTSVELKKSRERFKMAVEASKAGLYEWNKDTGKVYTSPYYKKMLGYAESDLESLTRDSYKTLLHPEDQAQVQEVMDIHFLTRQPYHNEHRIKTKNGDYKWVSDSGLSTFNDKNEPIMTVGSIIDIDERKKAEKQILLQNEMLAKTNEELDRFVYSASHDLRAPLSSLLGLITIAERTDKPDEVFLCLEMMKKRVGTMEGFIKDITDYSRNARMQMEYRLINMASLVGEVIDNLKFTSGAEKIKINMAVPTDLNFTTDINRLKIILNNLLSNAIRYHDAHKREQFINIEATMQNDQFIIALEDNGLGIAPEHLTNIFNMFYRASESSEGSGLGLYIVKETLAKLNGCITVTSTLGIGSTFTITLPEYHSHNFQELTEHKSQS